MAITIAVSLKIDWALLRKQKLVLIDMLYTPAGGGKLEAIEGILNLLDSIQDQAAEQLGEGTVFGKPEKDYEDIYTPELVSELMSTGVNVPGKEDMTCNKCRDKATCRFAWDLYNIDGDCIASK